MDQPLDDGFAVADLSIWIVVFAGFACIVLSICGVLALLLLFLRRGARREDLKRALGYCQSCGYNLYGNVSGICPECGTPTLLASESLDKAVEGDPRDRA